MVDTSSWLRELVRAIEFSEEHQFWWWPNLSGYERVNGPALYCIYEPTLIGLCIQGILVINKISNLEIFKD
jgi:hypothetical protein